MTDIQEGESADVHALVINRNRRLKWPVLDPLEALLMILCGLSITGFSLSVLADVITREIGAPWLWLQQVTTGFFAWGVFLGIGVATRRNEHLYLAELVNSMRGATRIAFELLSRGVVMVIAGFMDTSLLVIVGVLDLVGITNNVVSQTEFLGLRREMLVFITVVYFSINFIFANISRRIEASSAGKAMARKI